MQFFAGLQRSFKLLCFSAITSMLKKERQTFILHQVNLHNKVLSVDLSQQMKVSEDTIRRDLNEMAYEKKNW